MAIKRYFASKDNTITNAFKPDLSTRATASNMGAADVLETFSIYGQASASSGLTSEISRILISFPISDVSTDRTNGGIPASGSVSFYLKMFNAEHGQTLPRDFKLEIKAVTGSRDWEEGNGLDMEGYSDVTQDQTGSNWANSQGSTKWTTTGGDYPNQNADLSSSFAVSFTDGTEDLEVDITTLVEQWIDSTGNVLSAKSNYGMGIMMSSSHESASFSYYTKKFFARSSEFFFKRPVLEARWDSRKLDNRGNFIYSSSLATADENMNKIYLYNYFRGQLRNIPGVGTHKIFVSFFSGSAQDISIGTPANSEQSIVELVVDGDAVRSQTITAVTGNYVSTGIYSASVCLTAAGTPLDTIYDVWFSGGIGTNILNAKDSSVHYHTGSIRPQKISSFEINPSDRYVTKITNLKSIYSNDEIARFRTYIREKGWSPNIYTVANTNAETIEIESGSFKVFRVIDELDVIPHGTGSDLHTCMGYDISGNYFDLDMGVLEPGYMYGIKFMYYNGAIGDWIEQPEIFKFRVEE